MKFIVSSCIAFIAVCFVHYSVNAGYVPRDKTCPKYEVWLECGQASPCQTECATLGQNCTIVNIRCPDGCYCIDGYARNSCGKCIPIHKCKNFHY